MTMNSDALSGLCSDRLQWAVNRCVQICLDRHAACSRAAEDVTDSGLKVLLTDFAEERRLQAQAFLTITESRGRSFQSGLRLRRQGATPVDDRTVVHECLAGDEASRVELQTVFGWAPLMAMPMDVRAIMMSTYCGTLRLLLQLRRLLAAS